MESNVVKTDNYELYNGDNIEIMDLLISQRVQVDLTVTSPPYDDLRSYDGTLNWNFEIFKEVAQRLYDITKDGGVVVWIVNDRTINGSETGASFKQALYFKEIGFNLWDTMIYLKSNGLKPNPSIPRYAPSFEYMFVLSKGKPKHFNGIEVPCLWAGKPQTTTKYKSKGKKQRQPDGTMKNMSLKKSATSETKRKSNVWEYLTGYNNSSKDKIAFEHPAIFPEKLAEDHILSWSNEGDIVFDPFMGSNTTGKMALLNNRKFIGIEKVKKYFEISKKRIVLTNDLK